MSYKYPDFAKLNIPLPLEILLQIQDILRSDVKWRAEHLPKVNRCFRADYRPTTLFRDEGLLVGKYLLCHTLLDDYLITISWWKLSDRTSPFYVYTFHDRAILGIWP